MRKSVRRSVGAVAALALVMGWLVVSALPAAAAHGISISKECVPFSEVGQPYQCKITVANLNVAGGETSLDTLHVDGVTDNVLTAGGPVSSNTVFPGGLLPQFSLTLLGGATCNVGQTSCTLPSGSAIVSAFFSWYTPTPADFGLPNHTLVDSYVVAWHDECNVDPAGCNPNAQSNSAGAATTLVDANIQISPLTDTNPVNINHTFLGHVNVSCEPASATCVNGFTPAPAGTTINFSKVSGPGGFVGPSSCNTIGTTGECTVQLVSATAGVTTVSASTSVIVHGLTLNRATGDGKAGDSANATKTWVDARISIAPNATNEVGQPHTFTVTVQKDLGDGNGFVAAPGEHVDVTLTDSGGAVHSAPTGTCTNAGPNTDGSGQCGISFTSNSTGTVTGHASVTVVINGASLTRSTSSGAPNSDDAVKTFVNANIQITPATDTNAVGTNHVLTITVNALNGTLGNGTATASIVSGPGSFVGPNTCNYTGGAATATCTVTITSAVVGTTVVSATSGIPVNSVPITRTTNTAVNTAAGGSDNASKVWVNANIQITPATDTNPVGTNHVLTVTVNAINGTLDAGPHTATASIVSGPGSFVGPNTCTYTGGAATLATCTVTITSAVVGTTVVSATSDIPVNGQTITRTTGTAVNTAAGGSDNASKIWVNANIQITPATDINPVGTNHVLTITVNAVGGTLDAGPHTATASIVSGPGSFVGSPTCTYTGGAATATCTVVITSATAGTTVVSATSDIPVNGQTITRTTNTAVNTAAGGSNNTAKNWADAAVRTDIHDSAHNVITTAAVGTVVHDKVFVTKTAATPAAVPNPTGNVTFHRYTTNDCTGASSDEIVALAADGTAETSAFTVTAALSYKASYAGDANYPARDGACEPLNSVNANIQITPATANNAVGTNHVLTITVNALGGTLDAGPHTATASIVSGPGSFVGPNTCTYTGGAATATCTVTITSAVVGTTVVSATSDIPVSGQTITRTTNTAVNTAAGGSGNTSKVWVNANIAITPASADNPVGTNHVLTITVNAFGGTLDAGSHNATASIVSGPGSFVGSPTCSYTGGAASASCTVTITSATAGTTVVSATSDIPVNGQTITRATNTAVNTAAGGSDNASKNWAGAAVRTDIHDTLHNVVLTVTSGTVVHDKVFVTKAAGTPAAVPNPTGNVTFHRYTTNNCTGTSVDQIVALAADGTAETSPFTATAALSYKASYAGDANYPAGDGACEPLALTTLAEGRATGGGSIFATINGVPNVRVTHGFELRCTPNDKRQSLEINWDGGNNFHLEKIINSVICFDDPATNPPPPPGTVIDTYAGDTLFNGQAGFHGFGYAVGTGRCNKEPATIWFILTDAGEPGTADIAEYHIRGTGCTLDAGPALITKGNQQFHKN